MTYTKVEIFQNEVENMLSPLFWMSFVVVALGMKWVADGLLSIASLDPVRLRKSEPVRSARQPAPNYDNKKAA